MKTTGKQTLRQGEKGNENKNTLTKRETYHLSLIRRETQNKIFGKKGVDPSRRIHLNCDTGFE